MNVTAGVNNHKPRKRFGQHFLVDQSIIEQIVACAAPQRDDCFIEIGPGLGALTKPLMTHLDALHVVELDRDIIPRLSELPEAAEKLQIHETDALQFEFSAVGGQRPLRIIGNLPYNISTPLIFHLLKFRQRIADMHFMLQKEVVNRLAAHPGNKDYGRLSVITQYHCEVTSLLDVPPNAFDPPPKVDSAVVRLRPRAVPPADVGDFLVFETLVRDAFQQRRKTLRNNLKSSLTSVQIASCGVDPGTRAETLEIQDFAVLSKLLSQNN